jgi:hypothetical protein
MVISSRTPEGLPNCCPVCHSEIRIEPSNPAGDAPCPRCGHLLWFASVEDESAGVFQPGDKRLTRESLNSRFDSVESESGDRFVLNFSDEERISSGLLGRLNQLRKMLGAVGR